MELLHPLLVRRNGCAFDTNFVLYDSICCVRSNLIICLRDMLRINVRHIQKAQCAHLVSVLQSQIVVLDVQLQIRKDELYDSERDIRMEI
jgi:hypothetical protein